MDFETLKVIWDKQNREPLYVLNEAGLHAWVRQEDRRYRRSQFLNDLGEIAMGLMTSVYLFVQGIRLSQKEDAPWMGWCLLIAATAFLFVCGYMLFERLVQRRREASFDVSLKGDLGRALCHLDFHIKLLTNILWWCLIPVFSGVGLVLYVISVDESRPELLWLFGVGMLVVFVVVLRCNRRTIQGKLMPRKQELELLRDKLVEPNPSAESECHTGGRPVR